MTEDQVEQTDEDVVLCEDCGKPEGTFACKIRHVQINSGVAKAAKDAGNRPNFGFKDREGNTI